MIKLERKDPSQRIGLIDEIRGALIILVVIYHAVFLYFQTMPILTPDWLSALGLPVYVGAGLFILISGACCQLSRNNFKRGIVCFLIGCAITVLSLLYKGGDLQILWGILHLLGFSMILYDFLEKPLAKTKAVWAVPIFAVLFILTFRLKDGYFGIPYLFELDYMTHSLPQFLFPLGITYIGFNSADYYPLLPWFFLFLIGSYLGRFLKSEAFDDSLRKIHVRPLAFVGRHTLLIYLAHIPLLIGIYWVLAQILY